MTLNGIIHYGNARDKWTKYTGAGKINSHIGLITSSLTGVRSQQKQHLGMCN
jgi:hypothetical protein